MGNPRTPPLRLWIPPRSPLLSPRLSVVSFSIVARRPSLNGSLFSAYKRDVSNADPSTSLTSSVSAPNLSTESILSSGSSFYCRSVPGVFIMKPNQRTLVEILRIGLNFLVWELCRNVSNIYTSSTSSPSNFEYLYGSPSSLFHSGWAVAVAFLSGFILMALITSAASWAWSRFRKPHSPTPIVCATCSSCGSHQDPAVSSNPSGNPGRPSTADGRAVRHRSSSQPRIRPSIERSSATSQGEIRITR